MLEQTQLDSIKDHFNLNIYEIKIWVALLSRGISSASELGSISQVPRSRCYDVLEALEKKGFVIMKIGKPVQYIAVSPHEIIAKIKSDVESSTNKHIMFIDGLKNTDIFKELEYLHNKGIEHFDATDLGSSVVGRAAVNSKMKSMVDSAKKSVTLVTNSKAFYRESELLKQNMMKASKKGVKVTIAGNLNQLRNIESFKKFAKLKNTKLSSRFIIIDDREVLFAVNENELDSFISINSEFFATAMSQMVALKLE